MRHHLLTTKQHGIIDYIFAVALPTIPRMLGWSKTTTHLLDTAAAAVAVQSTLTDFEVGVKGVIPMQYHLTNDALLGAGLLAAAAVVDSPTEERLGLAGAGLLALAAMVVTEPVPRGSGRQRAKSTAKSFRKHFGESVGRVAGANPKRHRSNGAHVEAAATPEKATAD